MDGRASIVAAATDLHRTHFTNVVKHETGDTSLFYLRRMRIDLAREMLQSGDASITEIAIARGFESSQHFARIFHKFSVGLPEESAARLARG